MCRSPSLDLCDGWCAVHWRGLACVDAENDLTMVVGVDAEIDLTMVEGRPLVDVWYRHRGSYEGCYRCACGGSPPFVVGRSPPFRISS